jgi:uncharacterized alpha-E superfamily protein
MLSRVADSVHWMARYLERAENVARFIDVNWNLTLDLGEELAGHWEPLVSTTGDREAFFKRYDEASRDNVMRFLALDPENPNSIVSCLAHARENARVAREVISADMWEELNRFYLWVQDAVRAGTTNDYEFFAQVKRASHQLLGATEATMSHGEAWHFARLGWLLERADKTSRILDVKYFILLPDVSDIGTPLDLVQWSALLKSASALEMYRREHGRIVPARVVEYLVLDRDFPRSIRFSLIRAERSVRAITGAAEEGTFRNRAEQELGRLRSQLDYTSTEDILQVGLHEFIDGLQASLNRIGEAIFQTFFLVHDLPSSSQSQSQFQ